MSESTTEDWDCRLKTCDVCGELLTGIELEHGQDGFGHQATCCECYEAIIRGTAKRPKRRAK